MIDFFLQELRYFFICLSFLTRIPPPKWVGFQKEWLDKSIRYSPLVGILLGTIQFSLYFGLSFFFSEIVSFTITIGFLLILTGAFHEDGFADFCDGIGGGWNQTDILRIMKDSRVGSFGAIGISLLILLKIIGFSDSVSRTQLNPFPLFLFFITAHSFSRFISLLFMFLLPYAKEEGYAKPMAKEIGRREILFAMFAGVLPCFTLIYLYNGFWILLPIHLLTCLYIYKLLKQWIQGFTGDCLGAVQQISETIVWISGVFLWNYT